ncbi:unnamed protein product [Fraxinus pennsylvanica]|uniref:Uncharacterized protein n=1 Tax=Fraxinus pennsylvanica TaxID=56036 RepID=A0AAD1YTC2_9LAMI|nr:unnamed protein product [Fraxinus pennsylvanica]
MNLTGGWGNVGKVGVIGLVGRAGGGRLRSVDRAAVRVQHIVKYNRDGSPVQRLRMKAIKVHSKNIASRSFWKDYLCLCKELGQFEEDVNKIKPDYVKSFLHGSKLMPSTWIVIRIDGCHFHR